MGKIVALGAFEGSPDGLGASALGVTQHELDVFKKEFNDRVRANAAGDWSRGLIPMGPVQDQPSFAARNPLTCAAAAHARDWAQRPWYTKVMLDACSAQTAASSASGGGWLEWLLGKTAPVLDPTAISRAMEQPGLSPAQKAQLQAQLLQAQQQAAANLQQAALNAQAMAAQKARQERMLKTALVVALVAGAAAIVIHRRKRSRQWAT